MAFFPNGFEHSDKEIRLKQGKRVEKIEIEEGEETKFVNSRHKQRLDLVLESHLTAVVLKIPPVTGSVENVWFQVSKVVEDFLKQTSF